MIIPDNVTPSWTNADVTDSSLYALHRNRLWLLNYCASIWPQVFSWTVVNIHPASPDLDYRFETKFANRAILVTVEWTSNGKGCSNSTCYATYPNKLLCTQADSPIIFPSGDRTDVVACQPACFAKRRAATLRKTAHLTQSLTDQANPTSGCPSCDLDEDYAHRTRLWYFGETDDRRIHVFDKRTGRQIGTEHARRGHTVAASGENNQAQVDVDVPHIVWDPKYRNCIVANDYIYRSVVEPSWRDTAPNCKLTNFEVGDDVVWGVRYHEGDDTHRPNYGFLVGHSTSYCRAFAKNREASDGSCYQPWWQKALAYTIAGDGIIHAIHAAVHPNQCSQNWGVESGDRAQVGLRFDSQTNYQAWRTDVNPRFRLPPPNVSLLDLGIDVRRTGNRLYWNNVEGVVSQFALFTTVAMADENEDGKGENEMDRFVDNSYRSYNPSAPFASALRRSPNSHHRDNDDIDDDNDADDASHSGKRLGPSASERLLREYRDLLRLKRDRFRERLTPSTGLPSSVDQLRDPDIDRPLSALWTQLRNNLQQTATGRPDGEVGDSSTWNDQLYNPPSGKSSIPYALNANEYAAQYFAYTKLPDDEKRTNGSNRRRFDHEASTDDDFAVVSPASYVDNLHRRRVTSSSVDGETTSVDGAEVGDVGDDASTIEAILEHIQDEANRNVIREVLENLGISLGFDFIAMTVIKKLLRTVHSSMLQVISRYGAGKVSAALAKIGIRLATGRMVGTVAARLSLKMMVMLGQAATVVGLVIDAISLVALIFDIAELAGWDPGHFQNETDLSFYADMAKYFSESLDQTRTGPLSPLDLLQLYYSSVDRDPNKSADESGNETRSNMPVDNAPLADVSATDQALHVDERLDIPKWFNREFTSCFRRDLGNNDLDNNRDGSRSSGLLGATADPSAPTYDSEHLPILNSLTSWNIVCALDYVGNLSTNSFGQRVFPDAGGVLSLQDADIGALVTEASYRQLYTTSSAVDLDHRAFNYRSRVASRAGTALGLIGLGVSAVGLTALLARLFTRRIGSTTTTWIPFWLTASIMVLVIGLAVVYSSLTYVPVVTRVSAASAANDDDDETVVARSDSPWAVSYYVDVLRTAVTN